MGYLRLFRQHPRILSFGILLTLFSSFGQTFLISIFVPRILSDLGMGTGAFGSLYAAATVTSALTLPFFGRWLDRLPLRTYSLLVGAGLMLSCLVLSLAGNGLALFTAMVGLRLTGQGLLGLTASTTMARRFTTARGKALSVTGLGYPLGEGLLPMAMVLLMNTLGWRLSWAVLAAFIALVLLPLIFRLADRDPFPVESTRTEPSGRSSGPDLWRDQRFWLLMPGILMLPFLLTGLFLYQIPLAAHKGWTAETMASAFVGFAAMRLLFSLVVGPWVDRWGAVRLFPWYLAPVTLGLVILHHAEGEWAAFVFLVSAGMSQGAAGNIMTALWTEVYGVTALGSVKSVVAMIGVLSTALSPVLVGWLLQAGVSFDWLVPGCILLCAFSIAFSFLVQRRMHPVAAV